MINILFIYHKNNIEIDPFRLLNSFIIGINCIPINGYFRKPKDYTQWNNVSYKYSQ